MATESGIQQRVHPCMVSKSSMLAGVQGVYNAVLAEGDYVGKNIPRRARSGGGSYRFVGGRRYYGYARGVRYKPFTLPVESLEQSRFAGMEI